MTSDTSEPVEYIVDEEEEVIEKPKRGRGRPKKEIHDEQPKPKPKRKCTPAQLEALARGRAKNKRFHPKQ